MHTGAVGAFGRLMKVLGLDDQIMSSVSGHDMGTPLSAAEKAVLDSQLHTKFESEPRRYGSTASWPPTSAQSRRCAYRGL